MPAAGTVIVGIVFKRVIKYQVFGGYAAIGAVTELVCIFSVLMHERGVTINMLGSVLYRLCQSGIRKQEYAYHVACFGIDEFLVVRIRIQIGHQMSVGK